MIKKKLRQNKVEQSATGGGPCRLASFSALEERVIHLTNSDRAVEGVKNANCFGRPSVMLSENSSLPATITSSRTNILIPEIVYNAPLELPTAASGTSENIATPENVTTISENRSTRKRKRNEDKNEKRQRLLEKQTDIQESLYKEIQKISKVNNETNQKMLHILEKTYDLKRKQMEWFQKAHKENLELMREKIELKKLELDFKENQYEIDGN